MHRHSGTVAPALAVLAALAGGGAAAAEGWGTLKGQVVFPGAAPARPKIDVTKDKEACLAKGPLYSEDYVVNPRNNGVHNVIVWLIDASGNFAKKLPVHPSLQSAKPGDVEMDQPCCQFEPHVLALREGQGLVFKNSAGISHNVHVIGGPKGPEFNVILPPGGKKEVPADDLPARPTPIAVKCDIHPWMNAWVRVFPHPYFAVTDKDGNFTIKDAPAGQFRIVMWQESVGWVQGDKKGTPVTIQEGGVTDLGKVKLPQK
jgi:hypothetical protein